MALILGLDLGEKRIGVAMADDGLGVATPEKMLELKSRKQLVEKVGELVKSYGPQKIVVGLPKTLKGKIGIAAQKIMEEFEALKEACEGEWILWDERMSTKEVDRMFADAELHHSKRSAVRDSLAAQRILQSYLDNQRYKG